MKIEMIPGSYVRGFWDFVWGVVSEPLEFLGGLNHIILMVAVVTVALAVYRVFPSFRKVVWALLASAWFLIVLSVTLILLSEGV